VLISVDSLRRDHLGIYGYERATSPSIDRFFAGGAVYEHAISPAPCTKPAVKQYLTGVARNAAAHPALAERLRSAGYATAAVVSQHHFRDRSGPRSGYARGFDSFDVQAASERDVHGMSSRKAREVTENAIEWLNGLPREKPFFLWLHYFDPHDPYSAPATHHVFDAVGHPVMSGDRRTLTKQGGVHDSDSQLVQRFTKPEIDYLIAQYDAEIRYVDSEVGRLLRALDQRQLVENSIIVFTADHGERLCEEDGLWDHCQTLHGWEINVPLMIRTPGAMSGPAGRILHSASTLDIVPTLLDALGLPLSEGLDGSSLLGADEDREVVAVWEQQRAIQRRSWKLVQTGSAAPRLYDLAADPQERDDLASEQLQVFESLSRALERDAPIHREREEESERIRRELKSLGYLR